MFGSRLLFAGFAVLFLSSCAEPKYEKVYQAAPNAQLVSEKVSDCATKFQKSGYCLTWAWETQPTSSASGALTFKIVRSNVLDDTAVPVDPDFMPSLLLWMPSMGHGSSPTTVERVDVGSFRAKNVFFVMPGQWQLKFQIKNGQTLEDEVVIDITI
jgi:hypothetical protein